MVKSKIEITEIIEDSIDFLKKKIRINDVYLFGSYASDNANEWSDIDLAVFSPDVDKMGIEEKAKLSADLTLLFHGEVELHLFPLRALRKAKPTNFPGYILKTGKKFL